MDGGRMVAQWRWLGLLAALVFVLWAQPAHASLTVTKTASPTVATPGTTVTYTISVYNSNPTTFGPDQLEVVDTLPANFGAPTTTSIMMNGAAVPNEVPQNLGGGSYRWRRGGTRYLLNPDSYLIITFTSVIAAGAPNGAYPNNVTVQDFASPPDPTVSTGPTAVVTIGNPPSLDVGKSVTPTTVTGSQTVTYTATATNSGVSAATGVSFVDTLPTGFTYVPGSATYNGSGIGNPAIAGQTLTWGGLPDIPSNASRLLTFQATTTATTGSYNNTITVNASNAISAASGPTAAVTVNGAAPLTISKTASTATVNPGNTFTYTIQINNPAGNPVAQIASIQDLLPPHFNYGFSSQYSVNGGAFTNIADPSQSGQTLTWTGGLTNIPAGGNVRLRFTIYAPTEYSGTYANVATANGVNFASVSTPPTASVTVNGPLFAISKTVNGASTATVTVPPAVTVNYRITVTNSAGITGTPVIRDTLPTGFTYVTGSTTVRRNATTVSTANPTNVGGVLQWSPGTTINNTQTMTVDFQVTVPVGMAAGVYPNNAQVTDANISGNAPVVTGDTAQVIVNSGGPNMQVSKTVDRSSVLAFETVVYTLHVENLATATNGANGLAVSDVLPTGFSYQPGTAQISLNGGAYGALGNPAVSGQTLTWTTGLPNPLAIGATADIRFTVQVSGNPGVYSNNATATGSNFTDLSTGPTATVTVGTPPNVTISKSASPSTVPTPGNATTYTITLTNSGGLVANNAVVTDTLPAGFTYVAGSSTFNGVAIGNPTVAGGTLTWSGPFTIPAGSSCTLTFGANTSATPGSYNNSATVSGSNFSTVSFGPGATVTVGTAPAISITETLSTGAATVPPAQTVTVTISLANAVGGATGNGTTLTITLPDDLSYVAGSAQQSVNGGAYATIANPTGTTGTITFSGLSAVATNQTNAIRFNVQVATSAVTGTYYLTAQATGSNYVTPFLGANDGNGATTDAPALTVTGSSAVDLLSFRARAAQTQVVLDWETGAEWQNLGFNLYRSETAAGPEVLLTPNLIGLAGSARGNLYSWTDGHVEAGRTYYYWLEDVEFGGGTTRRGPLAITVPSSAEDPEVTAVWQPPSVPVGKGPVDPDGPAVTTRSASQQLEEMVRVVDRTANGLTLELHTPTATVTTVEGRAEVTIPGLRHVWEDGLLRLPQAVVPVAIPAGASYELTVLQEDDRVTIPAPPLLANAYLPAPASVSPSGGTSLVVPAVGRDRKLPDTGDGIGWIRSGSSSSLGVQPSPSVQPAPSQRPSAVPASGGNRPSSSQGRPASSGSVGTGGAPVTGFDRADGKARHLQFAFGVLDTPAVPPSAALVGLDGQAGENRLLQLKLFPVRPDPVTGDLIQARTVRIRLQWDGTGSVDTAAPDRYAQALARLLDGRAGWQIQAADQGTLHDDWVTPTGQAFTVTVSHSGVQELTADQLTQAGVPLTQPERWQLLDHNRQVPLEVAQADGQLQAIRFDVPSVGGRYARENRYVLVTERAGTPLRTESAAAALPPDDHTATSTADGATYYWANMPADGASDHWFLDYVTPDHASDVNLSVTSPLTTQAAELTLGLRGMGTDPKETANDQVDVSVNGTPLGTLRWSGSTYLRQRLTVPAGTLLPGENRVRLTMPDRTGLQVLAAYVDLVSLHYGRDGDAVPVVQTPTLTPVPAWPLLHGSQQADYLIVAPQAFASAAERLADHRRGQGYMVTVIPAEAIWYEFGGGNVEPEAIRQFLRWTAYNWQKPRPTHVVLLGDGHFDYRNDFGTSPTNWLPPLLAENAAVGEIADDNAFACVMGDDPLPDLFLGRLPANSPEEADQLVTKVIAADDPTIEPWHKTAIAIDDDDEAGFGAFVGQTTETYSQSLQWLRLGMQSRDDLRSAWDGGASLVLYVGHGSPQTWGSEALLLDTDVATLQPNGTASLVVAADCLNGYFQDPDFPCLGELLLRAPERGAMAVFSTGGYTLPAAQYPLVRQFLQSAILAKDDLGTAAAMAKLQMVFDDAPMWQEELRGWNLLGDPASRMPGILP